MNAADRMAVGAVDLEAVRARAEAEREAARGAVSSVVEVTAANVDAEVIQRSAEVPVVVLVGSGRSPDSEQLRRDLTALATNQGSPIRFIVAYVDADAAPTVAAALGVAALPTVLALAVGRVLSSFEGPQPAEALASWVSAIVSQIGPQLPGLPAAEDAEAGSGDDRLAAAQAALRAGRVEEARDDYRAILDAPDGADIEAARRGLGLAELIAVVREREASTGVDPVASDQQPGDLDAAIPAAESLLARGEVERAFQRLIDVIAANPAARDGARQRLLELFGLFEPGDPRVLAARSAMASALF